jgi:polyphosphate kinase 2 (PPK2 family)
LKSARRADDAFLSRIGDEHKIRKLSPMDLESDRRWYDRGDMLARIDTSFAR